MIVAAADGSSLANPGPSGWAWYIDDEHWHAGGWPHGTNNMGELMAVLDLLRETAGADAELVVLCDSQYAINSISKWMPGWKRKGWKKRDGKPVLNVELLQELDEAMQGRAVEFRWVKGHAGHELNEAADNRARAAATAFRDGTPLLAGPGFSTAPVSSIPVPPADAEDPAAESPATESPAEESAATESPVSIPETESPGEPTHPTPSPEPEPIAVVEPQTIIELERSLLDADVRASPSRYAELLHPDFVEVTSRGVLRERAQVLASLAPLPGPVEVEVLSCRETRPGQALLLWRAVGATWAVTRSSLWVREADGWLLRFQQSTRV